MTEKKTKKQKKAAEGSGVNLAVSINTTADGRSTAVASDGQSTVITRDGESIVVRHEDHEDHEGDDS
jgi:hypothetical protein